MHTVARDEPHEQRLIVANVRAQRAPGARLATQRRQMVRDDEYEETERGIFRLGRRDGGEIGSHTERQDVMILPHEVKEGMSWSQTSRLELIESRMFAADDQIAGRRYPVQLTARIAALDEAVRVPAGVFAQCVRVDATGETRVRVDRGNVTVPVEIAPQDWYAAGVGRVKSMRIERAQSSFLRPGSYTLELVSFHR